MKRIYVLLLAVLLLGAAVSCAAQDAPDYAQAENWAYMENEADSGKPADIFFVCPTVYTGTDTSMNMPLADAQAKADFLGAINMEKGIYDNEGRFFAPYYRQAGLNVYTLEEEDRQQYLDAAFEDVKAAFEYYYTHYNDGRPLILAGFSQGADMCLRLMKECFADEERQQQLIACYAVGWRLTEEEMQKYPQLTFAEAADDTGVTISFNSEDISVAESLIVPEGTKTLAINPLTWTTATDYADRSLNEGACFTDYDGNITEEIPRLTGAYIDPVRGTLKVPDVTPEDYPAGLDIFSDGVYHLYDYQFFYRNLQENVQKRVDAYIHEQQESVQAAA